MANEKAQKKRFLMLFFAILVTAPFLLYFNIWGSHERLLSCTDAGNCVKNDISVLLKRCYVFLISDGMTKNGSELEKNNPHVAYVSAAIRSLRMSGTKEDIVILIQGKFPKFLFENMKALDVKIWNIDKASERLKYDLKSSVTPKVMYKMLRILIWKELDELGYQKAIFLDNDVLVLRNIDELFSHSELSAVPDLMQGFTCKERLVFNAGVMVFEPSITTFQGLKNQIINNGIKRNGGNQIIFNLYFSDWKHLSLSYNVWAIMTSPVWGTLQKRFQVHDAHIVHFAGQSKPSADAVKSQKISTDIYLKYKQLTSGYLNASLY